MSICLSEYSGIHAWGGKGFLKSLTAPTPILTPMNILEIAIRPTSLCMRLFGNVLGAFVIMELIKLVDHLPAIFKACTLICSMVSSRPMSLFLSSPRCS